MATRSRIGIENQDGTVTSVYCHCDGYPENNGRILNDHYQDRKKVEKLIALGSISILGKEIDAPEGHSFETPSSGVTVAYHRDRGEPLQANKSIAVENYFAGDLEEYGYLFTKDNEWVIKDGYSARNQPPQKLSAVLDGSELLVGGH